MSLIRQSPTEALRACFHFRDGSTNTLAASRFFEVSQRTVQHWLHEQVMPAWAVKLLDIHFRGYLPCNDRWKDFFIIGDTLHFQGYRHLNKITPEQLRNLEVFAPQYRPNDFDTHSRFFDSLTHKDKIKPAH